MNLKPLNDHLLVECKSKYGVYGEADDEMGQGGYTSGVVLKVGEDVNYLSAPGWVFEASLDNSGVLKDIKEWYKGLIGKEVYWEQFAERGQTVEEDGKTYAFIRFTKLVGVNDGKK